MYRTVLALAAAIIALPLFIAGAALPESGAVAKGVEFIRSTQQPDGGFGGFGPGQTADAIFAIRAGGFDPATVSKDGKSPADFLKANAAALAAKPALAAKAALAATALGLDPRSVGGTDFVAAAGKGLNTATGKYADDDFSQSLVILGLACTKQTVPAAAATALTTTQLPDGSWGFGGAGDPDTTAIATQALLASGLPASDAAVAKAIARLKATQAGDGGWGFDPAASDATSTAFVVQALLAAGEKVESATYTKNGRTPVAFMLGEQLEDGSFKGYDPAFAANQVVPALAGRTFCNAASTPAVAAPPRVASPSPLPSAASPTPAPVAVNPSAAQPTPTVTTAPAPLPPNTGTGLSGNPAEVPLWVLAVFLAFATSSLVALSRRRRR